MRHPRSTGTYAKLFERYVREKGVLTVEQAVHKATGIPARIMRFDDRGVIKVGAKADLVLFDVAKVRATSTYVDPFKFAEGFDVVVVNGAGRARERSAAAGPARSCTAIGPALVTERRADLSLASAAGRAA